MVSLTARHFARVLVTLLALLPAAGKAANSPRIAVVVDGGPENRTSRIYVANPDGTGLKPVTPGTGRERAPAFSPDGQSLAYQTGNELGLESVVVQPLEGGQPRILASGGFPQWSRDGKRILFSRRQLNDYSLYVIRADGTESDQGLKPLAKGQIGRWSPDETQLAAVAPVLQDGRDRWQIQVMPAGAAEPSIRLTLPEAFGQVVSLDWSPDGKSLLFSVARQARHELYVVDLRAPEPRRLPPGDSVPNAGYGSWSPDGKEILFRSATGEGGDATVLSRLCVMKADGSDVRVVWEPNGKSLRLLGTAWQRPPVMLAANPAPAPPAPAPEPPKPAAPVPAPMPAPMPMPAVPMPAPRELGPPRKLHSGKTFAIDQPRSPASVRLAQPGGADFVITVPVLPTRNWAERRQGVGITLELEDGGLYRGTVIWSGTPWVTLQGRPKGGKVRMIDGKKLPPETAGFARGFQLTLRRQGDRLIIAVNGEDVVDRPVITSNVKLVALTLENFDPGVARLPLGNIYYREWQEAGAAP